MTERPGSVAELSGSAATLRGMVSWNEVEKAEPEFAASVPAQPKMFDVVSFTPTDCAYAVM